MAVGRFNLGKNHRYDAALLGKPMAYFGIGDKVVFSDNLQHAITGFDTNALFFSIEHLRYGRDRYPCRHGNVLNRHTDPPILQHDFILEDNLADCKRLCAVINHFRKMF